MTTKTFTNWEHFVKVVEEAPPLPPVGDPAELEEAVNIITEKIATASASAAKTKSFKFSRYGDLPFDIKQQIVEKNRLKNRAYRTGDPAIKRQANAAAQHIKNLLKEFHSQKWDNKVEELSVEDNNIYKVTRALTKGSKQPCPYLEIGNTKFFDPKTKVELFADSLCNQFSENNTKNPDKDSRVTRTIEIFNQAPLPPLQRHEWTQNG